MFDKLIDVIVQFIEDIVPFFVILQYNEAVLFRFGKAKKVLKPGFHWKIPFFDKIDERTVITTTLSIPEQSLTTKEGESIVVKAVVKYSINDIWKNVLEIYDPVDAIADTTQATIKEEVTKRSWSECADNEMDNDITKKVRLKVKHWGVNIEKVTLTDNGRIKSLRIFMTEPLIT